MRQSFPSDYVITTECEEECLIASEKCEESIERTLEVCRGKFLACVLACQQTDA